MENDTNLYTTLSIGSFDGCHTGHQKLIRSVVEHAQENQQTPTILTFYPHPRDYFQNIGTENSLFTPDMKVRYLSSLGIEKTIVQEFDSNFANHTADWFFTQYLEKQLRAKMVIVGPNFCFGKNREGNAEWLLKQSSGPQVKILSPQVNEDQIISSSRIRKALKSGNAKLACSLLGREYVLDGQLVKGNQIGRSIGVPTFNLSHIQQLIPKFGVYAGWVWIAPKSNPTQLTPIHPGPKVPAVINIGIRPTVKGSDIHVEAHALAGEWGKEIYGHHAGFYLHSFLRDEIQFNSLDSLKDQIQLDIQHARSILQSP